MSKKKRLIIPIFIPFGGCEHICVFCNQAEITGTTVLPDTGVVKETIKTFLSTWRGSGPREVAFYGGSFTGLPFDYQKTYLDSVKEFLDSGEIDSIRLSTRPDCIDNKILTLLKDSGVGAVELGVQSMDDLVLKKSGRGHNSESVRVAVKELRKWGFNVGLQLMPGLPGDTSETVIHSAKEVMLLKPDFVRIYPTLVIKDTPLYTLYKRGDFKPWDLEPMVEICKSVYNIFIKNNITVIRVGLQPTEDLKRSLVAGPFHSSFRELVTGEQRVLS